MDTSEPTFLSKMSIEELVAALSSTCSAQVLDAVRQQKLSGTALSQLSAQQLESRLSEVSASGLVRKKLKLKLQELQTEEREHWKRSAHTTSGKSKSLAFDDESLMRADEM